MHFVYSKSGCTIPGHSTYNLRGDPAKFSCDWGLGCGSHNGAQHGLNQNTKLSLSSKKHLIRAEMWQNIIDFQIGIHNRGRKKNSHLTTPTADTRLIGSTGEINCEIRSTHTRTQLIESN